MANPLKFTVSVLLICFFTLTINALDPFDDPTLQIIREQDKEEGFDTRHNEAPNEPVAESRPDMSNAMDTRQEVELAVDRTVNEIPTDSLGPDVRVKGSYKIISGNDDNNAPIETNIVPVMDKVFLGVHLKRQEGNIGEYGKREARAPEIAYDNNGEDVSHNDNRIVEENTTGELQKANVNEIENEKPIKIEENTGQLENEIQKDAVDESNNGKISDYKQTEIDYIEEIVESDANEELLEPAYNEHVEIEKEEGDAATKSFQSESETVQEERIEHEEILNEVMIHPNEGEAVENQVDYEYPGDYEYDENAKEVGEGISKEKYDSEQISEFHEYEPESLKKTVAHPEVENGELPLKTEEVPQAAQISPKYIIEEAKEVEKEEHEEGFMAEVKEKQEIKHKEIQEEEPYLENHEVVEEEKEVEEEGEVEEQEAVEVQNEIEEHGAVEKEIEEHEAVEEENEVEEHEAVLGEEEVEEHEAVEEENEVEHEAVEEEIEEHEAVKEHNEEGEHEAVEEEIEEHEAVVGEEEVEEHEAVEQEEAVEEQENVEDEENEEEEREEERNKYDGNEREESVPMEEEAGEKSEEEHEEEENFPNELEIPGTLEMEMRPLQDFEEKMVPRPEFPDDICSLPVQSGFCRAFFRRYFYNTRTSECEPFVYGGCGGNKNNFESLLECMQQCPTHFRVW